MRSHAANGVRSGSLLFWLALSGCAEPEPEYLFVPGLSDQLEQRGIAIPPIAIPDSLHEYTFVRIAAARVDPSGDLIAILDDASPFLRIFDREGNLRRAFVPAGGGPGESRNPLSIAIDRAGRMLVMDAGRLTLFDSLGSVVVTRPLDDIAALEIAAGCNGRWIIYGPERRPASDSVGWIHAVEFEGSEPGPIRTLYRDTVYPHRFQVAGRRYGLQADDRAVRVRHEYGRVPTTVEVPCTGASARVSETPTMGPPEEFVFGRSGEIESISLDPYRPLLAGMAIRGSERIWAGWAYSDFEVGLTSTRLVFEHGDGVERIEFAGGHEILDSNEQWVLISRFEPVPRVLMIPSDTFFAHIKRIARSD